MPTPSKISPATRAKAGGVLSRLSGENLERGMICAKPFAIGAGSLVAATALDGFATGMGWQYPQFMRGPNGDRLFGKIDWRLYLTGVGVVAYMLEADSEYEDWQDTTAAITVGLVGSYVTSELWGGASAWGGKLAEWARGFGQKHGFGKAQTTVPPTTTAKTAVKGFDESGEVEGLDESGEVEGLDESGEVEGVLDYSGEVEGFSPGIGGVKQDEKKLIRLDRKLKHLQTREEKIAAQRDALRKKLGKDKKEEAPRQIVHQHFAGPAGSPYVAPVQQRGRWIVDRAGRQRYVAF